MDNHEIDRRIADILERRWPQEIGQWQERNQTFISYSQEKDFLIRIALITGLELAIGVIEAEPELPGPMPRAYEELSREELCRRAVQATKRLTTTAIQNIAALAWAEAKPPRKKTIVEIVQERGGTIDPNYQSPEAFLRTCGPFQGDVDGDDAEAKKGTQ